jgi:hypothetical protein
MEIYCETTTAIPHTKEVYNLSSHCRGDIKSYIVIYIG